MACNCNGNDVSCGCVCQPGRKGDPGPANTISIGVDALPAGSEPTVTPTGVAPVQHFQIGFPLTEAPPIPEFIVGTVNDVGPDGPPTVDIDNTDPGHPILNWGLQSGIDGDHCYTKLLAPFVMPVVNGLVTITVEDTDILPIGKWIAIADAGAYPNNAGYFVVASNALSPTQIVIRNPGAANGITPANGYPSGLPLNAAPGTTIANSGFDNQVIVAGVPGPRGPAGLGGLTPVIQIWGATPTDPPASPALAFGFVINASPPAPATEFIPTQWNGSSWQSASNIAGAPGSQTFFGGTDPNIVAVSGSRIGDVYWRVLPASVTAYQKISDAAWTNRGSFPLGRPTLDIVQSAPGAMVLDVSYTSFKVSADKPIELDWNDTSYNEQAEWTAAITNTDAGPIDLTFANGRWEEDPVLSIAPPVAIAAGDTLILKWVKNMATGLYCVTHLFVPAPLITGS